ncbi:alpha/beta hydrolase [Pseudoxanthomonas sp.]|uniref:alpha/beta fold hydrolase n=1 Tax=Pseudoxanthomonas sp. TaxID=1871049 RepID=UPI002601633D|nr:alpha/beta hydrolase [Pseudoxanthomonas sp.]WDS37107.1 MAG: alpha/beta hydrolase [Pseudoxanthomonas sp.]
MQSLVKSALFAAALSSGAVEPGPEVEKPTVVLVHGAFADGHAWDRVIPLLQAKGLNVVAVQNPLSSFEDDVAKTKRTIQAQSGPIVLVGHSYGGAVITDAGEDEHVKALVYVAAFAPSNGQSVSDLSKDYPTPSGFNHLNADKDGFLTLTLEGVQHHLAQDLSPEDARLLAATQNPTNSANFSGKATAAAWTSRPTWYVVSEQDHMLDTGLQKDLAKKLGAKVVSLQASHVPQLSQPQKVAEVILAAVDQVSR